MDTDSHSRRRLSPDHRPVIDYGVAPLELPGTAPAAAEIEEFEPPAGSGGVEAEAPVRLLEIHDQEAPGEGGGDESGARLVEFVDDAAPLPERSPARQRSWPVRALFAVGRGIAWLVTTLFGIASLIVLLAVIAAIPILNFLALGYLLEVEGRVARSGRLRDAFPLLQQAPRLGSLVLGLWLWTIPLRLLSHFVNDAHLIDPGSRADAWRQTALIVAGVLVTLHMTLAVARGGSILCFFRPIKNIRWILQRWQAGDYWSTAEQEVATFLAGLRLKHHFLLGLKGFCGALAWLVIPTALFAAANKTEGLPILITLFGGLLMVPVLMWVPLLQAHLAAENRLGAMFELRRVRELYKHAPFSWLITILITFALALPMYLFKVAVPPQDALWLVTIVFVVSIYPARVLTGWAYYRAAHRERRTHWLWRWICWIPTTALVTFYVFLLYFTQFIGKYGKLTLFEHHSFLLPSPSSFFN